MPSKTPLVIVTFLYLIRLGVSFAHGHAHEELSVPLAPWQQAFVWAVVVVVPTAAVIVLWLLPSAGVAWALTAALAAGWLFGLYFHFGPANPDHVSAMPDAPARSLFVQTAIALAVVEPLVAVAAGWLALSLGRKKGASHA